MIVKWIGFIAIALGVVVIFVNLVLPLFISYLAPWWWFKKSAPDRDEAIKEVESKVDEIDDLISSVEEAEIEKALDAAYRIESIQTQKDKLLNHLTPTNKKEN